jgi:hypothetical protein
MKKLYILLLFAFTSIISFGQDQSGDYLYLELGKTAELTDELLNNSRIPLPVGIKSAAGGYEKLAWLTTSDKIIAVKADGRPTDKPLGVFFDAHFDNYLVSLDINLSLKRNTETRSTRRNNRAKNSVFLCVLCV